MNDEDFKTLWDFWTAEWHHHPGRYTEVWFGYGALSDATKISEKKLIGMLRVFRDKGIAYRAPLMRSEGFFSGSGNFIWSRFIDKSWDEIKELIK